MTETATTPTYGELVKLLLDAPPRHTIEDPRYWAWKVKVDAALARVA